MSNRFRVRACILKIRANGRKTLSLYTGVLLKKGGKGRPNSRTHREEVSILSGSSRWMPQAPKRRLGRLFPLSFPLCRQDVRSDL